MASRPALSRMITLISYASVSETAITRVSLRDNELALISRFVHADCPAILYCRTGVSVLPDILLTEPLATILAWSPVSSDTKLLVVVPVPRDAVIEADGRL